MAAVSEQRGIPQFGPGGGVRPRPDSPSPGRSLRGCTELEPRYDQGPDFDVSRSPGTGRENSRRDAMLRQAVGRRRLSSRFTPQRRLCRAGSSRRWGSGTSCYGRRCGGGLTRVVHRRSGVLGSRAAFGYDRMGWGMPADRVGRSGVPGEHEGLTAAASKVDGPPIAGSTGLLHPVESPEPVEQGGVAPDPGQRGAADILERESREPSGPGAGEDVTVRRD